MNGRLSKMLRETASNFPFLRTRSVLNQIQAKDEKNDISESEEWINALPFESMPGPSKLESMISFMPGGRYYKKKLFEIYSSYRKEYGDTFMVPGLFGKRNVVFSFDPEIYEKIYRTEGIWPIRRDLEVVHHYRRVLNPHIFTKGSGLITDQGEAWAYLRTTTNPVMLNPKIIKFYIPRIDNIVQEFVEKIKSIRDPNFEVPANFANNISYWAMESTCMIALDTQLGLINHAEKNPEAKEVIDISQQSFELICELTFEPSLWKIIPTTKYKKFIENFDKVTNLIVKYIDAAIERLENDPDSEKPGSEKSVLERLLKIDREVAIALAIDFLFAGVETTSSALTGCLLGLSQNPKSQDILRSEILKILPQKDTSLNADKMKNLPYLRACIKEALRCFPVIIGHFRSTGSNLVFNGYRIPKETDVSMPTQMLLWDEKFYPRPNEFIPERWLRDVEKAAECPRATNVNPFIYLPFGFGPRACIGRRISELELEIALCRLIRNYYVKFDYEEEISYKTTVFNAPDFEQKFNFKDVEV